MTKSKPGTYLPSGRYLHDEFNVDPKTGLVRLGVKNEKHPPYESHFERSWGYLMVKNPTPLQKSICDVVSQALGTDWLFRQFRDYRKSSGVSSKYFYKSELKWGNEGTALVLIYQRNAPIPSPEYGDSPEYDDELKECKILTQGVKKMASDKINELVAPRYTLNTQENATEVWWDMLSCGQGDCRWDPKIILVQLYFSDKIQTLDRLQEKRKKGKGNLQTLDSEIAKIKAELGK